MKKLLLIMIITLMLIILIPFNTLAAVPHAMIGDTIYSSLEAAVENVKDGDDIILLMDDDEEEIVVDREVFFRLLKREFRFTGSIEAGKNYKLQLIQDDAVGDVYNFTKQKSPNGENIKNDKEEISEEGHFSQKFLKTIIAKIQLYRRIPKILLRC